MPSAVTNTSGAALLPVIATDLTLAPAAQLVAEASLEQSFYDVWIHISIAVFAGVAAKTTSLNLARSE